MNNPTRELIVSKFCANCGALVEIEKTDDIPAHCKDCKPWVHVSNSVTLKMEGLLKRHEEAIRQLAAIEQKRREEFVRIIKLN